MEAKNVVVLAGGRSGEREISIESGHGARAALERGGHTVTVLDPADDADLHALLDGNFDLAFLCLHGRMGEDGTIQGMLEVMGIPYTGSGVLSSALAMDKARAKVFYDRFGVQTPESEMLMPDTRVPAADLLNRFGGRCVVKPANEGSALGVAIVDDADAAEAALDAAFAIDDEVLVERYIAGTELTVAVLGNEDARALPVIQIVPRGEFYDFDSKYAPGGSTHICPAPLSDADTERVQQMAVQAHLALGCRGVSRTDIILDDAGECWALETNTIPGMTETSLLPDAGRAAGMDFSEVCDELIRLALA